MFPAVYGIVSQESNWYDGLDAAWQGKGAASAVASYTDLTGNGNTATQLTTPPVIGSDGWDGNGSAILSTGINPGATESVIIRVVHPPSATDTVGMGVYDGVNRLRLFTNLSGNIRIDRQFQQTNTPSFPYDITFILNGDGECYINGVSFANSGAVAVGQPLYFLGENINGSPSTAMAVGTIVAIGMRSSAFTAGEVATYTSAVAAL